MSLFVRGLIVAGALFLAGCATNIVQEKASRFDQGVAAYDAGDYSQAYKIWNALAGENDLAAMRNTANLLRQGRGVEKDQKRAFKLYLEAAEKGLVTAMANVGDMYLAGEGTDRNPQAAAAWYARAASAGLSLAQVKLAELYEQGVGVEKDVQKSRILYERAARNGYAPAQAKLRQIGPQAAAVAAEPPQAAAAVAVEPPPNRPRADAPLTPDVLAGVSADDALALNTGLAAYRGGDKTAALNTWRLAAARGVAEAQTRVGLLYARGDGVAQDVIEGYRWLRLAAGQGNAGAWVELPLVAAQLSPAERAIGESLVRQPGGAQTATP